MNAVEKTLFSLPGIESQFFSCPPFLPGLPIIFLVKIMNYKVSEYESVSRDRERIPVL
jgi:hypothetical protein